MQIDSEHRTPDRALPALAEFQSYCRECFDEARALGCSLVRLSVPAPVVPLLSDPEGSVMWCWPKQSKIVGKGSARSLEGRGPERLEQIKEQADRLWKGLHDRPHPQSGAQPARLFGGLSFSPQEARGPWAVFGEARFDLPELVYGQEADSAWLSLCVDVDSSPETAAQRLLQEQSRLLMHPPVAPRQAQIERAEHLDRGEWKRRIESIQELIESGEAHKIVAARRSQLHFSQGIELRPALERLAQSYPDCYLFAMQREGLTFLGASPETLIEKQGLEVHTHALAGSIDASLPDAGCRLLESNKDRYEQELVVQAIRTILAPLCSELRIPATPSLKTLRHLSHLCTPIRGELSEELHVLDLVAALHPTPAVGGLPAELAMSWISENEANRGWYAAPVGYFDAEGDGHFAVAIRSALLSGTDATVYAGAGIVADSDSELEYDETGLKQRAILDALGILE